MSNSIVQVPIDSSGKKIDTEQLTVGANTVERQRIQIAGVTSAQICPVSETDGILVNLGSNNDVVADTELPAAAVLADNAANPTTPTVGAAGLLFDGATWDRAPGNSADGQLVNLGANNDVVVTSLPATPAGDNNIGNVDIVTVPSDPFGANADAAVAAGAAGTIQAKLRLMTSQLDAIKTSVELLDNALNGGGAQFRVDIISGAGTGGTSATDDDAFTAAVGSGTPIMGFVSSDQVNSGDVGVIAMTVDRFLRVDLATRLDSLNDSVAISTPNGDSAMDDVNDALRVNVVAGSSAGVEYTEGDVDASITGKAALMEVAGNTLQPIQGTVADGLLVNLGANNDVTVTGSVTANAGTNLNTSALALEAGGNLAAIAASASVLDDWDESDRAKVNIIAGQAGITAGAGAVGANTPRVTLASDDPVAVSAALLDDVIQSHDSGVTAKVSQIGLEGRNTEPTAVGSGDATRALASLLGKQIVLPYSIPASSWSYASPAAVTDTADDEAKAAGGVGNRHYITGVQVFNGHDTVGTEVVIKDGTTILWRGWAEEKGGGCSARFDPPLRGTANAAVNVANITNSSSTYFNLQGYTAAE